MPASHLVGAEIVPQRLKGLEVATLLPWPPRAIEIDRALPAGSCAHSSGR